MAGVDHDALTRFWEQARTRAGLGRIAVITGTSSAMALPPPAVSFGREPEEADAALVQVLAGARTATSTARHAYETAEVELPRPGDLAILLDGAGAPRALLRTTGVRVVALGDVDDAHARREGAASLSAWHDEQDASLAAEAAVPGAGPAAAGVPVVLETFELVHPRRDPAPVREPARV